MSPHLLMFFSQQRHQCLTWHARGRLVVLAPLMPATQLELFTPLQLALYRLSLVSHFIEYLSLLFRQQRWSTLRPEADCRGSGRTVLCELWDRFRPLGLGYFRSHASAGHLVFSTTSANHPVSVPPTGCVHRDAFWCGRIHVVICRDTR